MYHVIKNKGKIVQAYQLGSDSAVIKDFIRAGKIVDLDNGWFEIYSQEAVSGASGHGQLAGRGDWIKTDGEGFPYPNDRAYFETNHTHIEGDTFEQRPKPLRAWDAECGMCDEIEFLMEEKGLKIDTGSFDQYYSAELWGTHEVANKDAVIVFYNVSYDEDGKVSDIDFNFVTRSEFERTYSMMG